MGLKAVVLGQCCCCRCLSLQIVPKKQAHRWKYDTRGGLSCLDEHCDVWVHLPAHAASHIGSEIVVNAVDPNSPDSQWVLYNNGYVSHMHHQSFFIGA